MIHVSQKKQKHSIYSYLLPVFSLFIGLCLLFVGAVKVKERTSADQLNVLTDAIRRSSIQCYAIEGRYPPSVEYLEEHYGLSVDHDRYHVFYSGWASNIMPDITVIPVNEA